MKYLYQNTGIIVESDSKLDSACFKPIEEEVKAEPKPTIRKRVTKTTKK